MPIPKQTKEEMFSVAYCHAVGACAGLNCGQDMRDFGLDGSFSSVSQRKDGHFSPDGLRIDYQAKSTSSFEFDGDFVVYDLEVKNYRDLIVTDISAPRILILYLLPKNESNWMIHKEKEVIFRHGAYWYSLRGMADTTNTSTIRIRIPKRQVFTSTELNRLFSIVKRGDFL